MKFSDFGTLMRKGAELGSHAYTILDLTGAIKGGPAPEHATAVVKGLHGVFGKADEREFEKLLQKLDAKKAGSSSHIIGFMNSTAFRPNPRTATVEEKFYSWWMHNKFRTYVVQLGSTPGPELGTKTTKVMTPKHGKTPASENVTTEKMYGPGMNHSLVFLEGMIATITSEATSRKGYAKLIKEFEAKGIPKMPKDTETLQKAFDWVMKHSLDASDSLVAKAEELKAKQSPFERFIANII